MPKSIPVIYIQEKYVICIAVYISFIDLLNCIIVTLHTTGVRATISSCPATKGCRLVASHCNQTQFVGQTNLVKVVQQGNQISKHACETHIWKQKRQNSVKVLAEPPTTIYMCVIHQAHMCYTSVQTRIRFSITHVNICFWTSRHFTL